jgi:ribosomal protein S18 acetylase RimI-like enzyme
LQQPDKSLVGPEISRRSEMKKRTFSIRPYQSRDEPEVVLLVGELQQHESAFFDRMLPPADIGTWYLRHILQEARHSGGELMVAELDGRIVAYATVLLAQTSENSLDEVPYTYAAIGDLIVTESARALGVGAALLRESERRARAAGERWLRVNVLAGNERALRTYRRFGFAEHLIEMEKPLG